jgi:polysaccharide export outer membrane protein
MDFKILNFLFKSTNISYFIVFCFIFTSCQSHKELITFRSGSEKTPTLVNLQKQEILNKVDLKLQPDDVLAVVIASSDPALATPYNITTSANSSTPYIVNSEGVIEVPTLGAIKVAGLTVKEVRQEIIKRVSKDLINPIVTVRLTNFKVSVLGEVIHPGEFQIDREHINILEVLSKAGDFTSYSDRRHVMVIRETNGIREVGELNLKDTLFFSSPYFFLKQNDIIYIEPMKGKIAQVQQPLNTYLQPVQLSISIIAFLIALFRK